jgi:uncharacterized protein
MSLKQWQPVAIGGVSVVVGFWLVNQVVSILLSSGSDVASLVVVALGGIWLLKRVNRGRAAKGKAEARISRDAVETRLAEIGTRLEELASEVQPGESLDVTPFYQRLDQLRNDLDRQDLRLAVIGAPAVGKTSLVGAIAQSWKPPVQSQLLDTQSLSPRQQGSRVTWEIPETLLNAEIILFVTDGELSASELRYLEGLCQTAAPLVVCNKADLLNAQEQQETLAQLQLHLQTWVNAPNLLLAAAGQGEVQSVISRLDSLLQERPAGELVLAALDRGVSRTLQQVDDALYGLRRQRAIAVIERYQWIVAGTVFVNPLSSLDVLATVAVNTQMLVDLSQIYRRPFSLEQAKTVALQLAELALKQGLVEWSTQALAIVLKSNVLTYLAGGAVQACTGAYLTRMVGLAMVEYFRDPSTDEAQLLEGLLKALTSVFKTQQQSSESLKGFAQQARTWLAQQKTPATPASLPSTSV